MRSLVKNAASVAEVRVIAVEAVAAVIIVAVAAEIVVAVAATVVEAAITVAVVVEIVAAEAAGLLLWILPAKSPKCHPHQRPQLNQRQLNSSQKAGASSQNKTNKRTFALVTALT